MESFSVRYGYCDASLDALIGWSEINSLVTFEILVSGDTFEEPGEKYTVNVVICIGDGYPDEYEKSTLGGKEIVNGDYVMVGGVDQVNVLQNGTVDEIKRITEQTIKVGKPGGKFILQSADFLEYGTPLENIQAYKDTAMQFAGY